MIQENIKTMLSSDWGNYLSHAFQKALIRFVIFLGLFIYFLAPAASAKLNSISAIYFNSDSSVVIETEYRQELNFDITNEKEVSKILIHDISLNNDIPKEIQHGEHRLIVSRLKSAERAWFKSQDQVIIEIYGGKALTSDITTVLNGLAYQIDLGQEVEILELAKQEQVQDVHKLNASLNEKTFLSFIDSKSVAEEFLESIDLDLSKDEDFISDSFQKIDSTSLTHIGSKLETMGHLQDAFRAYNEALEIDPKNINARLGLARTSVDRKEKLQHYIAAIDDQALNEIGKEWHKQGLETKNPQDISKSLIPFQLSILKNPKQPEARFAYAEILEDSGPDFYGQASKRYLEAAVLAKHKLQVGDASYNSLMRKATESLIRTLTFIGDQDSAVKYCNSYLGLGFSNFLDGRSIASIIKEIKFNRNPFLGS